MADLISREGLLAEYDRVHIGPPGGARKLIADAKAVDAVQVVRCKDCKRFEVCFPTPYIKKIPEHAFCSYGERRTDETL